MTQAELTVAKIQNVIATVKRYAAAGAQVVVACSPVTQPDFAAELTGIDGVTLSVENLIEEGHCGIKSSLWPSALSNPSSGILLAEPAAVLTEKIDRDGIIELAISLPPLTEQERETLRGAAAILRRADNGVLLWEHCNNYRTRDDVVELLETCAMRPRIGPDPNEGNPFEPPESPAQQDRRVGEMIRVNADARRGL